MQIKSKDFSQKPNHYKKNPALREPVTQDNVKIDFLLSAPCKYCISTLFYHIIVELKSSSYITVPEYLKSVYVRNEIP
jgi:hypothetical protein